MDEILEEFLAEAASVVEELGPALERLAAGQAEACEQAYRAVHTIRGAAGFLALSRLETITASGERLLSGLRDGKLKVTAPRLELLRALRQELILQLSHLRDHGEEAVPENPPLPQLLDGAAAD